MREDENKLELSAINEIADLIKKHRENAYRRVNEELIDLYYEVGMYLSRKINTQKWGSKTIESISKSIKTQFPTMKGFSRPGLYRMVQFYETYRDNIIVSTVMRQISWTNHIAILNSTKTMEEKIFYINLSAKYNYSVRELQRQINSHYYERYMLSQGNAEISVEPIVGEEDYPNSRILDTFSLEFLDLPNNYKEKDLRDAIIDNMKDFILEIGKDFTFVDKEHRITVGGQDFYIDLLFFNRHLNCLVAIELKIGEFIPEYVSKMDFYLEALDRHEKKEKENPSIGIILCSKRNKAVVEYATARNLSPLMISQYETELIDKKLLQNKLIELNMLFDKK